MKLSKWLKESKTSVRDLATACNVSTQAVYKWRRGTVPLPQQMSRLLIATGLQVTANDFVGGAM